MTDTAIQAEKKRIEQEIERTKQDRRDRINQLKADLRFLTMHPKLYFETAKAKKANP